MDKNFWYAVSIFVGTMVGVGMFALPYSFYKAGFFVGSLYLGVLFFVLLALHLMLGEVVLRTTKRHRFAGYIKLYLGKKMKDVAIFSHISGVFGSLLVYILISGFFLNIIAQSFLSNIQINQVLFWFVMSVIVLLGVRVIKKFELILMTFLGALVIIILFSSLGDISSSNFFNVDFKDAFLPYGVIMYALVGISAIPLMREFLNGKEIKLKKAIIVGLAIAAILYFTFTFVVVGVSGALTSEDALTGLLQTLGYKIAFFGALFGLLAVTTSYIAYAFYLKETLTIDFDVSEKKALLLILSVPILALFLIPADFIELVIFLGAVLGGIDAIFVAVLYKKAKKLGNRKPEYSLKISKTIFYFMMTLFFVGIFYEIVYNL